MYIYIKHIIYIYLYIYVYVYIYVYKYICICMSVLRLPSAASSAHGDSNTINMRISEYTR